MNAQAPVSEAEGRQTGGLAFQRRRNNQFLVALWIGVIIVALFLPGSPADGIVICPFRALTSLSCPGCGMTRSCSALMHGDLWTSLEFHPLGWAFMIWFTAMASWRGAEVALDKRLLEDAPGWLKRGWRLLTIAACAFILLFGGARLALEIAGILTPV